MNEFFIYWLTRFMVWALDRELQIAQSTGRNPDSTRAIRRVLDSWTDDLRLMNLKRRYKCTTPLF